MTEAERGLGALFASGCRTTWLQQHDMDNATPADLQGFLARVAKALRAMR